MPRAAFVLVALLLASPADAGRCPKKCKKLFASQQRTCQQACPDGKAGRECRSVCGERRRAATRTCKATVDPEVPSCGLPLVTPTTTASTTTEPGVTTTSTTVFRPTTTTLCVPRSCADVGAECGMIDDGCGGALGCGSCPVFGTPICVGNVCRDDCIDMSDGTSCDSDTNGCTLEQCSGGACVPVTSVSCDAWPCYATAACNPATGVCEPSGYLGDAAPCTDAFVGAGVCTTGGSPYGYCAAGKSCVINTFAWAAGERVPDGACRACVPEVSRTVAIPVGDGLPCNGGFCTHGTCSGDVCSILGQIVAPGASSVSNPCRTCQPAVSATEFSPLLDGTSCQGGVCIGGTCETLSCTIDGIKYPDGAVNPRNACQDCVVAKSRTSWTTRANNEVCGGGCASGFCSFGKCFFLGTSDCPSSECGFSSCNATTGRCDQFGNPAKLGLSCTRVSANPCLGSAGTCDDKGNCVAPPTAGASCLPLTDQGQCRIAVAGTCDGAGNCVGNPAPDGTPCTGDPYDIFHTFHPCGKYECRSGVCSLSEADSHVLPGVCPPPPDALCPATTCDSLTRTCQAGSYANGVKVCTSDSQCCGGQVCSFPVACGALCFSKQCYYPGTNVR